MIIYVGIPSIDGKPYAATVDALMAEQLYAQREGVYLLVSFLIGCSLIGHARNQSAKGFLDTPECECMVFVDADISWPAGELVRLAKRPEGVIGGTYRTKQAEVRFNVHKPIEPVGDLYRVAGLPTGFLKISRKAFERIKANAYDGPDGVLRDYFPTGFHGGVMYGEDYGFCRLWREAGGECWLDPSIKLRHHDGNLFYDGDLAEWLANA